MSHGPNEAANEVELGRESMRSWIRRQAILAIALACTVGVSAFYFGRNTAPLDGIASSAVTHYDELCPTALANLRTARSGIVDRTADGTPAPLTTDEQQRAALLLAQEESRISICDQLDNKAEWRTPGITQGPARP